MDFINKRRLFVAVQCSKAGQKELDAFVKSNNIYNGLNHDGNPFDSDEDAMYHVTLWYSRKGYVNPIIADIPEIEVDVENWELLGKNKEHLTLKLKPNAKLKRLRDEYGKYGLESEWPKFKPHITICYHYNKPKIPKIAPPKTVKLGCLFIEEKIAV